MPRILVVDEEPDICRPIQRYAEHDGYDTVGVPDQAAAVALCRREDFDLVIMDIMMPGMDGYTACRRIRAYKDIPVLLLSARGEEVDKLYGFEVGADDCVAKPFSPRELMARIHAILLRSRRTAKEYDLLSYLVGAEPGHRPHQGEHPERGLGRRLLRRGPHRRLADQAPAGETGKVPGSRPHGPGRGVQIRCIRRHPSAPGSGPAFFSTRPSSSPSSGSCRRSFCSASSPFSLMRDSALLLSSFRIGQEFGGSLEGMRNLCGIFPSWQRKGQEKASRKALLLYRALRGALMFPLQLMRSLSQALQPWRWTFPARSQPGSGPLPV